MAEDKMETISGEQCPICGKKTATLVQMEKDIPFGEKDTKLFLFSISCSTCKYHSADVEFAEHNPPVKYTLEVDSEEDMKIRVVKSAEATVKIPHIMTLESSPSAEGYVSNVEGLLNRVKKVIELARDSSEDEKEKKRAKNLLKKLQRVVWGQEKVKIIIEDKTGNSAIISPKVQKSKL